MARNVRSVVYIGGYGGGDPASPFIVTSKNFKESNPKLSSLLKTS